MSRPLVLRDYQQQMLAHIEAVNRCGLFVSPGLGKTPVVLSLLAKLKAAGEKGMTLVLAPRRVAESTWPTEALEWDELAGLKVQSLVGATVPKRVKLWNKAIAEGADVVTINFESFEWLLKHLAGAWPFTTVVVDEASKLRGLRARQGTKRAGLIYKASRSCKRLIELTGSPAPKGLLDLYGLMLFLDDGAALGKNFYNYADVYFSSYELPAGGKIYTALPGSLEKVTTKLRASCLSLRPEYVFKVDQPQHIPVRVKLSAEARLRYNELARDMVTEIDGQAVVAVNNAVQANKLLQAASGTMYAEDGSTIDLCTSKLDALDEIVEELNGEPLAVVVVYRSDMARIKERFPKARELKTDQDMKDWNAGKVDMILLQPASVGHGVSLQHGGRNLCFFNQLFDYELFAQVAERLGPVRQKQSGYDRVVRQFYLIGDDTYDEVAMKKIATKAGVENSIFDGLRRA